MARHCSAEYAKVKETSKVEIEQFEKTARRSSAGFIDESAAEEIEIRQKNVLFCLFSNQLILNL